MQKHPGNQCEHEHAARITTPQSSAVVAGGPFSIAQATCPGLTCRTRLQAQAGTHLQGLPHSHSILDLLRVLPGEEPHLQEWPSQSKGSRQPCTCYGKWGSPSRRLCMGRQHI